jgi:hypothetical protein
MQVGEWAKGLRAGGGGWQSRGEAGLEGWLAMQVGRWGPEGGGLNGPCCCLDKP